MESDTEEEAKSTSLNCVEPPMIRESRGSTARCISSNEFYDESDLNQRDADCLCELPFSVFS